MAQLVLNYAFVVPIPLYFGRITQKKPYETPPCRSSRIRSDQKTGAGMNSRTLHTVTFATDSLLLDDDADEVPRQSGETPEKDAHHVIRVHRVVVINPTLNGLDDGQFCSRQRVICALARSRLIS